MYAILIQPDGDRLGSTAEPPSVAVARVLAGHGFARQQGGIYFGDAAATAVTCVLAAADLARSLPWFAAAVRELRIAETADLRPAVRAVGTTAAGSCPLWRNTRPARSRFRFDRGKRETLSTRGVIFDHRNNHGDRM